MTRQADATALDQIVELVAIHGSDAMAEAFASLLEIGMKLEREQVLGAKLHERNDARRGYANGYKPKTLDTRAGPVTVQVPKAREFYPASLERGIRSERALKLAIAEMYVKGVSTRKVAAVMEQLCGLDVSSTQVSRAAAELDAELEAWRSRPIGATTYLILDARYEKVRHGGSVVDCAIRIWFSQPRISPCSGSTWREAAICRRLPQCPWRCDQAARRPSGSRAFAQPATNNCVGTSNRLAGVATSARQSHCSSLSGLGGQCPCSFSFSQ